MGAKMKYCFGIDLGGTTVKCGFFREEGELLEKWEIVTNHEDNGRKIPRDIADTILAKMKEKGLAREDVTGVGMGIPGPVNS
jgi:glucokinase